MNQSSGPRLSEPSNEQGNFGERAELMAQLFPKRADRRVRAALAAVALGLIGLGLVGFTYVRSDAYWNVGVPEPQPIPFRHDLHVGSLGLDCRYCHTGVERASAAGLPSAETCLTCHSEVWAGAGVLEPLRTSAAFDAPLAWRSVHALPEFAYFHHGIHVSNGVACEICHGRVDEMTETVKAETLSMGWCLDCHRDPKANLRPPDQVFAMGLEESDPALAQDLARLYEITETGLTDCSTCHR